MKSTCLSLKIFYNMLFVNASRLLVLLLLGLLSVGSSQAMDLVDVTNVLQRASARARRISPNSVIAVVDREGFVLAVWAVGSLPSDPIQRTIAIALAVSKAGTAAFLSSDGEALTSRSAGFIVQQHFPPGINYKPPGPLVGVNFSNLDFSDVNRFKDPATYVFGLNGGTNGAPISFSSLAGAPGGVPLYKNGHLIGGVGVSVTGGEILNGIQGLNQVYSVHEDVALAGQAGYAPNGVIWASHVFIDGIRLPYVQSTTSLAPGTPLNSLGAPVVEYPNLYASPAVSYPKMVLGKVNGEIRQPIISDPLAGAINGQPRLTATEVKSILALAAARARITRAGIRLPAGRAAQVFITVVNNPAQDGVAPTVLGTFRTPDATIFSWDVAVQKARTALFFSDNKRAFSTRTVGFLSQTFYPPGINGTLPGPFYGLQEIYSLFPLGTNILNGVVLNPPSAASNPNLPNGITIFPGGFPLYRKGVLIGAIGVSGDGIDQDDLIGASGTAKFLAPTAIRADRNMYKGARLPYAKFPRNPSL